MPPLPSDPIAARNSAFRQATEDGEVSPSEARALAERYAKDIKSDPAFSRYVEELALGQALWREFNGKQEPVKVSGATRSILWQMLINNSPGGTALPRVAADVGLVQLKALIESAAPTLGHTIYVEGLAPRWSGEIPTLAHLEKIAARAAADPDIPFEWVFEHCQQRARAVGAYLKDAAIPHAEITIERSQSIRMEFHSKTSDASWGKHIAPLVLTRTDNGSVELRVIDPSMPGGPTHKLEAWLRQFVNQDVYANVAPLAPPKEEDRTLFETLRRAVEYTKTHPVFGGWPRAGIYDVWGFIEQWNEQALGLGRPSHIKSSFDGRSFSADVALFPPSIPARNEPLRVRASYLADKPVVVETEGAPDGLTAKEVSTFVANRLSKLVGRSNIEVKTSLPTDLDSFFSQHAAAEFFVQTGMVMASDNLWSMAALNRAGESVTLGSAPTTPNRFLYDRSEPQDQFKYLASFRRLNDKEVSIEDIRFDPALSVAERDQALKDVKEYLRLRGWKTIVDNR